MDNTSTLELQSVKTVNLIAIHALGIPPTTNLCVLVVHLDTNLTQHHIHASSLVILNNTLISKTLNA
jgi:hypothetical protein